MYDDNNVFAKIIRKEIPAEIVYEDKNLIAIKDISPAAPVHILAIPKGKYVSFHEFMDKAGAEEVRHFFATIKKIAANLGLEEKGYRVLSNIGTDAMQTVPHMHFHILAGKPLGRMVSK